MCFSLFACKCNCNFPSYHPPTGRSVGLEGQPALSERRLNTSDSLLSNKQQKGCQGRGGRRDRGVENKNSEDEEEGSTFSHLVPAAVNMGNPMQQTGKQRQEKGGRKTRMSENLGRETESACPITSCLLYINVTFTSNLGDNCENWSNELGKEKTLLPLHLLLYVVLISSSKTKWNIFIDDLIFSMSSDSCVVWGWENLHLSKAQCHIGEPSYQNTTVQVICAAYSPSNASEHHSSTLP